MNTHIISIPHREMRDPNSVGDYWTNKDGATHIVVSAMADWRYEFLIALHELVEEALTRHRGIPEPTIMAYDLSWGLCPGIDPGMEPDAPYHREHVAATALEMLVADMLGVKWSDYERACEEVVVVDGKQDR